MIPKHQQINIWMNMSIFSWFFYTIYLKIWLNRFDTQNATECTILHPSEKNSILSWFYHTIFKVLTTQILYPKCSRMHHFLSFWKKIPDPPLPLLVSRGLACMLTLTPKSKALSKNWWLQDTRCLLSHVSYFSLLISYSQLSSRPDEDISLKYGLSSFKWLFQWFFQATIIPSLSQH